MAWEVRLSGNPADLRMLANSFTGPDLIITNRGEEFLLTGPEFEGLNESGKIRERAIEILEFVNGGARLALESREPISIGGLYYRHADGRRDAYVFAESVVIHFQALAPSITVSRLDGSTQVYHPADPVQEWVALASSNKAVALALRLLSTGVWDWVNLYRIFEVVEADSGGLDQIDSRGWATKKAMRLFKHTANSPGTLGTEARHGKETTIPPPNPMSLMEAKSLIVGIVQSWLRDKTGKP